MKLKQKDQVVHYLLTQMTCTLLDKSPVRDALSRAAQKHLGQLRAKLTDEEIAPILLMRDTVTLVAHKLVNCNDVETLKHTHEYLRALVDGEVMVAIEDEDGSVTGYEKNR